MRYLLLLGASLLSFTGCAQDTWLHNSKSTEQFYQDKIKCRSIASRATPNISTSYQQPTSYRYTTQSNGYGGYSGVIQPTNTRGGFLAGVAAAEAGYPQRVYQETFTDCMRSLGWYTGQNDIMGYESAMRKVASKIKDNKQYIPINLDTKESKKWFKGITYKLWSGEINKHTFIRKGLKRYPNRKYEFTWIANRL